jgi:membrane-bound lytic murein transglycosylase D
MKHSGKGIFFDLLSLHFNSNSMKAYHKSGALFLAGIVAGGILFSVLAFRDDKKTDPTNNHTAAAMPFQWKAPKVPSTMGFAGENVPLDRWEIREAFDRELLYNYYQPNNILYLLKLANRYFPMIEARLKANGVPDDFKYLCVAESNLQNLTSRLGAKGFWQFMPATGPGYSLEISDDVDERYNPRKSTDAACVYLKNAYKKFNSWTAAAASYNCGVGAYNSQAEFQGSTNYYDLALPDETSKYIFRILTFKQLLSEAENMGYILDGEELYHPIKTKQVSVSQSIPDLAAFAKAQGTNYKMLKLLNPWLRSRKLAAKPGKTYMIDIPEGTRN